MQRYDRPKSLPNRNKSPAARGDHVMTAEKPSPQASWVSYLHRPPVALAALLLLTAGLRLVAINRPLVGPFATKNVVYAMIARNWAEGRASVWYPTLDCLMGGQRSLHMLEFPVSAYVSGLLWQLFGGSLDRWGRLTALLFSVAAVAVFYGFLWRRHGPSAALGGSLALTLAPVGVIYGQSFMLEASLVFFSVATIDAWDRWRENARIGWLLWAGVTWALLLLTKIYMAVLVLPLAAMLWSGQRRSALLACAVVLLASLPAAAWYAHAYRAGLPGTATGQHLYYSVRDSAEVHRPPHPLLFTAGFYGRLLASVCGPVLTPLGVLLFVLGLFDPAWRRYAWWLAAGGALLVLLPRKFDEMNYYFLAILPPLCAVIGLGWARMCLTMHWSGAAGALAIVLWLAFLGRYAVGPLCRIDAHDRGVVEAGRVLQTLAAPDEPVVTAHGTTIDLLYYCRRAGWAVPMETPELERRLAECRRAGARYFVVAGDEVPGPIVAKLLRVASGEGYAIYALADEAAG